MALDFLATNNWERPFYFAITVGNSNYLNLEKFFEMNGLSYRVIPAITTDGIAYSGGINPTEMYNTLMNKFKWGGIENEDVYMDENCIRMFTNIRHNFSSLAKALLVQGKADSARIALEKCLELIPNDRIPFDIYMLGMVETFYNLDDGDKAREIAEQILENTYNYIDYFLSLESPYSNYLGYEKMVAGRTLSDLINISHENGDKAFSARIQQELQNYGPALNSIFR
jgi:tetratricopeptide (TPR) repeat protein